METITIPKEFEMFKTYKTMLLAASKDETKQNIYKTVYCSGSELACTDGARLHIITNPDMIFTQFKPKTSYKILVNDARNIILQENPVAKPYPQYDVILEDLDKLTFAFELSVDKKDMSVMSSLLCEIYKITGDAVNIDYLKDLHGEEYRLYYDKENVGKPINFISQNMRNVIMPLLQEERK